jgi:hypothetical protein
MLMAGTSAADAAIRPGRATRHTNAIVRNA